MKQLVKNKKRYIVEDIPTLWLDIQVMRINSMINYINKEGR